jgi:DNA-binding HxlR family transcriptional regulator
MGGKNRAPHTSDGAHDLAIATISLLSGKWTTGIICALADGKQRFSALQRILPGISHHVLTKELKELQSHGIISRTVYSTTPPSVEYALTDSGVALCKVLDIASEWAAHHSIKESPTGGNIEITK